MRSYLIDEMSPHDIGRMREYLGQNSSPSELESIFWIPVPNHLLNEIQLRHGACHPLVFAVEVGSGWVKMEFLVRSRKGLKCECQDYATLEQMSFILNFTHQMIRELEIKT
ncbi:MAG: hypothetical protein MUO52_02355 [Desulfobacterales bacterium]|nr:hypothetical protein [Desulfobacterales bacterium]